MAKAVPLVFLLKGLLATRDGNSFIHICKEYYLKMGAYLLATSSLWSSIAETVPLRSRRYRYDPTR